MLICFDNEDADAHCYIADFFTGTEFLADADTFEERVEISFCDDRLALDGLEKSYKGRDVDGVGVLVDGRDMPEVRR